MILSKTHEKGKEGMMTKAIRWLAVVSFLLGVSACTTIQTRNADLNSRPDGVRVYPPKLYLFVGERSSWLVVAPDFEKAYDMKPLTLLAKHDFKVEMAEGMLTGIVSNQDTTSFLTFVKGVGELGAKAGGAGVSQQVFSNETFGLKPGIYTMKKDGTFVKVQ
jgi:hypothetical protein